MSRRDGAVPPDENRTPLWRRVARRGSRVAPFFFVALKVGVSAYFIRLYLPAYLRLSYIADGIARGILAYDQAFEQFTPFVRGQFLPLQLWLWAALLRVVPDIYWTGTVLNVAAGAGTAAFVYLLARRLGGAAAGATAALLFIFSPVHHMLTLSEGMAEPLFFLFLAAGLHLAARAEEKGRGSHAAAWCFAGAALTRYEGVLFLILYAGYRALRRRPAGVVGWLLWAAPLVAAAVILAPKAFPHRGPGLWPALAGVHDDTARVLANPTWYRRLGTGAWRIVFDGRAAGVLGLGGAALVFRKGLRTPARLIIWSGWAVLFVALTVVAVAVGVGYCPERYFAAPLLLLFPFAGLAAVELGRAARRGPWVGRVAVALVLLGAAAYQVNFDRVIRKYGYGVKGPAYTTPTFDAEVALKLRELWRKGDLGRNEYVYLESDAGNYSPLYIPALSDHPRNFVLRPTGEAAADLPYLMDFMRANNLRVAVFDGVATRRAMKPYYKAYKKKAVIYVNPTLTVVVRRGGWRHGRPDFRSRVLPGQARVIK